MVGDDVIYGVQEVLPDGTKSKEPQWILSWILFQSGYL